MKVSEEKRTQHRALPPRFCPFPPGLALLRLGDSLVKTVRARFRARFHALCLVRAEDPIARLFLRDRMRKHSVGGIRRSRPTIKDFEQVSLVLPRFQGIRDKPSFG